jgi:hypothetical protein
MWKVIGAMEGTDEYGRKPAIYGPLPCKVWTGGTQKRWRKIKPHVPPTSRDRDATRGERHAIEYAEWLCKRDGREVPSHCHHTHIVWNSVEVGTHERKRKWGGTQTVIVTEPRVEAVEWGHMREVYNERKDGRRGAWLYNEFVAEFRVDFPNWDFNPAEPQEEIVDDEADAIMAAYVALIDRAA